MAMLSRALATLLGIFVTPVLLFIVVVAAGGGHGTYWLAKTFFPWTMMATAVTKSIVQPFIAFAFAQYPLYGIILDWMRASGRLKPAALALAAVHLFAALLAFAISDPSFTP
jgi:hypothetical protein